ncbi:hypothetical protein KI387_023310, partial [Taxus chinensis]
KIRIQGIMMTTDVSDGEVYDGLCGMTASSLGFKIFEVTGYYVSDIIDKLVSRELVWLRCGDFTRNRNISSQLSLKKLRILDLCDYGEEHALIELWAVDSDDCEKLEELPSHITNHVSLRELYLDNDVLRELPIDIGRLDKLR